MATGVVWLRIWMYLRAYVNLFAAYTVEDISINGELTDSDVVGIPCVMFNGCSGYGPNMSHKCNHNLIKDAAVLAVN